MGKNNRDDWMYYFTHGWAGWWAGNPTNLRGLYGSYDDSASPFGMMSEYSSLGKEIAFRENPYSHPDVRKSYPAITAVNPMRLFTSLRTYKVSKPGDEQKIKNQIKEISVKEDPVIEGYIKDLLNSNEYKNGLNQINNELEEKLKKHGQAIKNHPEYANDRGRWDLEKIYRQARIGMQDQHQREIQSLAAKLQVPAGGIWDKVMEAAVKRYTWSDGTFNSKQFMKDYGLSSDVIMDTGKPDFANIPDAKKQEMYARELLSPLQDEERGLLEKSIEQSRFHHIDSCEKNAFWSYICSQQDPEVLKAAQEIRRIRCQEAKDNELNKLKKEQEAAGVLASIVQDTDYQLLSAKFLAENDEEGLPTLEDIRSALNTPGMEKKNFQFKKNYYVPFSDTLSYSSSPTKVTFEKDGSLSIEFPFNKMSKEEVLKSTEIRDASHDLIRTLQVSFDQEPNPLPLNQRKIKLVASSEEHAKVLARAALVGGFSLGNIEMSIRKDFANKNSTAEPFDLNKHPNLVALANKATNYMNRRRHTDTIERETLEKKPEIEEEQAYKDTLAVFDKIINAKNDKDFSNAVDGLNTVQFGNTRSVAGKAQKGVTMAANSIVNLLESVGYILTGRPSGVKEIFKPTSNQILPVKPVYSDFEKNKIREAAMQARNDLVNDWKKREEASAALAPARPALQ